MEKGSKVDSKQKRRKIKWFRWLLISLGALLLLFVFAMLLFANRILNTLIKEFVYIETNQVYRLEFEDIKLKLIHSSLKFENISLVPDTGRHRQLGMQDSMGKPLYEIKAEALTIENCKFWSLYRNKELKVKEIVLSNPEFAQLGKTHHSGKDAHKHLLNEIRNIQSKYLHSIEITELSIIDGMFDFYENISDSLMNTSIGKVSVYLKGFDLGPEAIQEDMEVLFSDDLEFSFKDISVFMQGKSHRLEIDSVRISSIDSIISLSGVFLKPLDINNREPDHHTLTFEVKFVELNKADILKLLFTDYMQGGGLVIEKPYLKWHIPAKRDNINASSGIRLPSSKDIYEALGGIMRGIELRDLSVNEAEINIIDGNDGFSLLDVDKLDLRIQGIGIDSNYKKTNKKLLMADEAELQIWGLNIKPGPSACLTSQYLGLSTQTSALNIDSVLWQDSANSHHCKQQVDLAALRFTGIDFGKLFDKLSFDANELIIDNPKIDAMLCLTKGVEKKKSIYFPFDFHLGELKMNRGSYQLELNDTSAQPGVEMSGEFQYFTLGRLSVDRGLLSDSSFSFHKAGFKLCDLDNFWVQENLKLSINGVDLTPEDSIFSITDAHFRPAWKGSVNNNSTMVMPVSEALFDSLVILGFDPALSFLKRRLLASSVSLFHPHIFLSSNLDITKHSDKNPNDHLSKFHQFFHTINIPHIDIIDLSIDTYTNNKSESKFWFNDNIHASFYGFLMDEEQKNEDRRLFYSDSIAVFVDKASIYNMHEKLDVGFEALNLSTGLQELLIRDLFIASKDTSLGHSRIAIHMPLVKFEGIDFIKAYYKKDLNIGSLNFSNPDVNILSGAVEPQTTNVGLTIKAPSFFNQIKLDRMNFKGGRFQMSSPSDTSLAEKLQAVFEINLQDIMFGRGATFVLFKDSLFFSDASVELYDINGRIKNGYFQYHLDTLSLTMSGQSASIKGVALEPLHRKIISIDSSLQNQKLRFSLSVPEIQLKEFDYQRLLMGQGLKLDAAIIDPGIVEIYQGKRKPQGASRPASLPEIDLPTFLPSIQVGSIDFMNIDLKVIQQDSLSTRRFTLNSLRGTLTNIVIDTATKMFGNRFLFSDDVRLQTDEYQVYTRDSMYSISARNLILSTGEKKIGLQDIKVEPLYPKYAFAAKVGYQTDRIELEANRIDCEGLNYPLLFGKGSLQVEKVKVEGLDLSSFRDKSQPFPEWIYKKMPQEMIRNVPLNFMLDTLQLIHGKITYGERLKKNLNDGEIVLEDFTSNIYNIGNDTTDSINLIADASFSLMGEGRATTHLVLPVNSVHDTLFFHGYTERMDLSIFNSMSVNLFGVAVKKGKGELTEAVFYGNKDYMTGHIKFPYRKFKIQMVNKHTGKRSGIGGGILSFLANEIFLKSNNPKFARKLRLGEVYCKRNPHKSVFNYLWKSMLSGVESTLGYNNKEQRKELKAFKKQQRQQSRQ